MPINVYFATNRRLTGAPALWTSYGDDINTGGAAALQYGVAAVDGTNLAFDGSGSITAIADAQPDDFSAAAKASILGTNRNLLVFIHGFCNSFSDAITRAAFNRDWFAAAGLGGADTTVIAFSWPSLGKLIAAPPQLLPDDYLHDQGMAQSSGPHIAAFLHTLQPLLGQARAGGRRVFLLAHSMGNYALQAAVQGWFAQGLGSAIVFDETILAAADERDDSFAFPPPARLSNLGVLTSRISIYHSIRDVAMYLSLGVNLIERIGFAGPDDKSDPKRFPPAKFRILDCAHLDDYNIAFPPDASHQYYRRSPKARADIAALMNGTDAPLSGPSIIR
jgi:esterase/lipase superfamily enzyme